MCSLKYCNSFEKKGEKTLNLSLIAIQKQLYTKVQTKFTVLVCNICYYVVNKG